MRPIGAVFLAYDEPQAGPRLVYRADLVVDESGGEYDLAQYVLGDVGGHAGGALGPRDPVAAVGGYARSSSRSV